MNDYCHLIRNIQKKTVSHYLAHSTSYHMPEMLIFRHILTHSYYQVNMARHHTHLPHIDHGVKLRNLPYFLILDDHTKF